MKKARAQTNWSAMDNLDACECGHAKWQHNDDGRCRHARHRCPCRAFVNQQASKEAASGAAA